MRIYRPEQRVVKIDLLTQRGWVRASIYVGKINLFFDAVAAMTPFLRLTDVKFEDGHTLPFIALHRNAIQILLPDEPEAMIAHVNPVETTITRVGCLLPSGNIEGDLRLLPDIRVSDFIAKSRGYVLLYNSSADLWSDGSNGSAPEIFRNSPTALVNTDNLIGVTETC